MRQLIVNNSDLTNTDIGKFLDQIKETHQGETIYYGKVDRIWFLHKNKRYRSFYIYKRTKGKSNSHK